MKLDTAQWWRDRHRSSMRWLLAGVMLVGFTAVAFSQAPVISRPYSVTSYPAPGSIAVTNTFQDLWAANEQRAGCVVQNTGTNPMYVFFGDGTPTVATSYRLVTNATVFCNVGNIVYNSRVRITGTATETFYAAQQ